MKAIKVFGLNDNLTKNARVFKTGLKLDSFRSQ